MFSYWSEPPTIAAGMYASASAHLNSLSDCTLALLGAYRSPNIPFTSHPPWRWGDTFYGYWRTPDGWDRLWSGYIRHKKDRLEYSFDVNSDNVYDLEIKIRYNYKDILIIDVPNAETPEVKTGYIDLSGEGLTVDEFYFVTIDATSMDGTTPKGMKGSEVKTYYIYESDPQSYATLPTFLDGLPSPPTVADWQALSTRISLLHDQLEAPVAPFVGTQGTQKYKTPWYGTFFHKHDLMYYDIRVFAPSGGHGHNSALVEFFYHNDSELIQEVDPGDLWPLPDDYGWDARHDWQPYRSIVDGAIDMSLYGLTVGDQYTSRVETDVGGTTNQCENMKCHPFLLFEQPRSNPTLTGWADLPTFSHGTSVDGTGVMSAIRDNLAWLSDRIIYRNFPVAKCRKDHELYPSVRYWTIRTHRWLHYYCEVELDEWSGEPKEGKPPSLAFEYKGKWEVTTLPFKPNEWLAVDLNSIEGLWEGVIYRVKHATFMLEDVKP